MRTQPVVEVRDLRKAYRSGVAVDGVSFEVARGEIFGLLGPNGAGKTTTVECVQGLRRADAGRISVLGLDPRAHAAQLRTRIGSQLQESALPDRLKVWEALDWFSGGSGGDWRRLMEQWGLSGKRTASFGSLSGGQRQRLLVALALVNDPELVFLDEMTTGLDPSARRTAWQLIEAIRDRGTTVVLVTHFMEEAERLCDRVAVMRGGKVVAQGAPAALVSEHAGGVRVWFSCEGPTSPWLEAVPHVGGVRRHGTRVEVRGEGPVLAYVAAALLEHGMAPSDLRVERPTLEDAFMALTGGAGDEEA